MAPAQEALERINQELKTQVSQLQTEMSELKDEVERLKSELRQAHIVGKNAARMAGGVAKDYENEIARMKVEYQQFVPTEIYAIEPLTAAERLMPDRVIVSPAETSVKLDFFGGEWCRVTYRIYIRSSLEIDTLIIGHPIEPFHFPGPIDTLKRDITDYLPYILERAPILDNIGDQPPLGIGVDVFLHACSKLAKLRYLPGRDEDYFSLLDVLVRENVLPKKEQHITKDEARKKFREAVDAAFVNMQKYGRGNSHRPAGIRGPKKAKWGRV
jgi:uncharacterized small protein (DUF1192 family)